MKALRPKRGMTPLPIPFHRYHPRRRWWTAERLAFIGGLILGTVATAAGFVAARW